MAYIIKTIKLLRLNPKLSDPVLSRS